MYDNIEPEFAPKSLLTASTVGNTMPFIHIVTVSILDPHNAYYIQSTYYEVLKLLKIGLTFCRDMLLLVDIKQEST